jgi:1-deoxy-D-xylulose-5-phosphate reductoisomerase
MDQPLPILLLGATGSIGQSTLDLLRRYPERFVLAGASAFSRIDALAAIAREFGSAALLVGDASGAARLEATHPGLSPRLVGFGRTGFTALLEAAPAALVVNGLVGAVGLEPTLLALERGHDVALANKEALVVGGELVLDAARRGGAKLWPVDSEHSAIAQCLRGNPRSELRRIWLTASGGPFRDRDPQSFGTVTLEEILDHPNWEMGPKITVDSATMMNKGLEVIEAMLLFGTPLADVRVVIHRQSIVHSMIEFVDGAFLAQLGAPDMRIPILYALSGGRHWECDVAPMDPLRLGRLDFEEPDPRRYPCLALARRAAEAGGGAPLVLNAANEEAVAGVLDSRLSFMEIPRIIEATLARISHAAVTSLGDALERDREARAHAAELVGRRARN